MKKFLLGLLLAVNLTSCYTVGEFKHFATYEQKIEKAMVDDKDVTGRIKEEAALAFEDEDLVFRFDLDRNAIGMVLENRGKENVKVNWLNSAIVMPNGETLRVFTSGTRLIERNKEILPSMIVGGGFIKEYIAPVGFTRWNSGYRGNGFWETDPLIPHMYTQARDDFYEEFKANVTSLSNKPLFSLLVNVEKPSATKNYRFYFKIGETKITSK